jgi:hypothetical protein
MLGKKRKIISRIIHQLPFRTKPLTVLLTPPINSPTGIEGKEKCAGAPDLPDISVESKPLKGKAVGGGSGTNGAGGSLL